MKGLDEADIRRVARNAWYAYEELTKLFSGPLRNDLLVEIVRADAQGRAND